MESPLILGQMELRAMRAGFTHQTAIEACVACAGFQMAHAGGNVVGTRAERVYRTSAEARGVTAKARRCCRLRLQFEALAEPERAAIRGPETALPRDLHQDRRCGSTFGFLSPFLERLPRWDAKREKGDAAQGGGKCADHPFGPAIERVRLVVRGFGGRRKRVPHGWATGSEQAECLHALRSAVFRLGMKRADDGQPVGRCRLFDLAERHFRNGNFSDQGRLVGSVV